MAELEVMVLAQRQTLKWEMQLQKHEAVLVAQLVQPAARTPEVQNKQRGF